MICIGTLPKDREVLESVLHKTGIGASLTNVKPHQGLGPCEFVYDSSADVMYVSKEIFALAEDVSQHHRNN